MDSRAKQYTYEGSAYTTAINVIIDLDESREIETVTVIGIPRKEAEYVIDTASGQGLNIATEYDEATETLTATRSKHAAKTATT